ncbi:MAG: hypothetical protein HY078_08730 [Elusimicrobia bacterium]|nr:hypothetical protein [Elusimicrobiota bacterium]
MSRPSRDRANVFLLAAGIGLLSLVVSFVSISRHFEGGVTWEFCQYAEIGRNLLQGKGYRTAAVTPYALAYMDEKGIPFDARHPAPVLDRFMLQSALTAAIERLCGTDDAAVAALSAILLAACAAVTVLLGSAFLTPAEGAAAGALLALNPSFQRGFVLWGLPDFGFLLAAVSAAALLSFEPGPTKRESALWGAAGGAAAGLAWLARSNLILWLPLFAWALWRFPARHKAHRAAAFVAALALVSAPGWIYNLRWFGGINPPTLAWNLAHLTVSKTQPWLSYRVTTVSEVLNGHLGALLAKFWRNLFLYIADMPGLWQLPLAMPFALAGGWTLLRPGSTAPPAPAAARWARLCVAMLALQILAFSLLRHEVLGARVRGRYLIWFAPMALLLAARGAAHLGRRWMSERAAVAALFAANAALFATFLLAPQGTPMHPEKKAVSQWYEFQVVAALEREGLIVSNIPTQVAWYSRKPAVALPATPEELKQIAANHKVAGVLICRLPVGELHALPAWREYLQPREQTLQALVDMDRRWKELGFEVDRHLGTSLLLKPIAAKSK